AIRKGVSAPAEMVDPGSILHEMRLIKTGSDLELMRRACEISATAHVAAMRSCRPGMNECELEAIIEYVFRRSGSPSPAYPSIVGAGATATILHYPENSADIREGEL